MLETSDPKPKLNIRGARFEAPDDQPVLTLEGVDATVEDCHVELVSSSPSK